jgi:hypothetical protein
MINCYCIVFSVIWSRCAVPSTVEAKENISGEIHDAHIIVIENSALFEP